MREIGTSDAWRARAAWHRGPSRRLAVAAATLLVAAAVGVPAAVGSVPAAGAAVTRTVCTSGCDHSTIQEAVDAATTGDTISVAAGTYVEDLTIAKQVTLVGPNAGVAAGPGPSLPTRAAEAVVQGVTVAGAGVTVDGVVVDGMKFVRPSGATAAVDVRLLSNAAPDIRTTVTNTVFDLGTGVARGCGSAFSSTQTRVDVYSTATLEHNGIYNHTAAGCSATYSSRAVYLDSAAPDAIVRDNYFQLASQVFATDTADRVLITGNWFQSGGMGIALGAIDDAVVEGNTFVNPQDYGIYLDQSVRPQITGNTFLDINASYPYVALTQTTDALIQGNTFSPTTLNTAAYWPILVGYPVLATGTTIINNDFTATTSAALWNCTASGTTFSDNRVASPGRVISSVSYAIRNGSSGATCAGQSLLATGNLWVPGSGAVLTYAPATTAHYPDLYSYTPDPAHAGEPGFWPIDVVEAFPIGAPAVTPASTTPVEQTFLSGGAPAGTITFAAVDANGETTVQSYTSSFPTAPSGFSLGSPPVYYTISTTATLPDPTSIEICLSYAAGTTFTVGGEPARPQLLHYDDSLAVPAWVDATTSVDEANRVVCGTVATLSPFALGAGLLRPVTINAVSSTKTYDGTTSSTGTPTVDSSTPLVAGDHLSGCTQAFDSAAASATPGDKTLTASGCAILDGTNADVTDAYTVTYQTATGTIDKAAQSITITQHAPATAVPGSTFDVAATASSSLGVTISTTGGCSGGGTSPTTITMGSGVPDCVVHYNQTGDGNYNAAPEQTETTTAFLTGRTIQYTGPTYVPAGTTSVVLKAQLSGPSDCLTTQPVTFALDTDGDGDYETLVNTTPVDTDSGGLATYVLALTPGTSLYEIEVSVPEGLCNAASNTAVMIVAGTGDTSSGGGWYKNPGRINFGYTVQVKTTRTATTVSGQMTWQVPGKTRFKGTANTYTKTCPVWVGAVPGGTCGYVAGRGDLYSWDSSTSSWDVVATGVGFRTAVADGGSATACTRKTCSTTLKPDYFAMDFPAATVAGEATTWFQLNGGNLTVK